MLTDKQIIAEIKKLSQIKPKKDWVFLTKKEILPPTTFREGVLANIFSPEKWWGVRPRYVLAPVLSLVIIIGFLGFAKSSLPGEPLYIVRKVAHLGRAILASETEKSTFQLQLANDRLEDLTKASPKNLAPTINEFQANISQAARELSKIDATTSSPAVIKKIVEETKKLGENKQKVESLGVVIDGTQELDDALGKIVGNLIGDLESRTLTEQKQETLVKMKEFFDEGRYSDALELYLTSQ